MTFQKDVMEFRERIAHKYRKHETHFVGTFRIGATSLQPRSNNRKLSHVAHLVRPGVRWKWTRPSPPYCSSTYTSISATCPSTCVFRDNGCYVQEGQMGVAIKRLDNYAKTNRVSGLQANEMEADLISYYAAGGVPQDGARGGRDMRLHVGGDVAGDAGAALLGAAAGLYRLQGGGDVWLYTHRWGEVERAAFGPHIHVLASTETPQQAEKAIQRGYLPTMTVANFWSNKAYNVGGGIKVVPCPAQTKGKKCIECRLCFGRTLGDGKVIGFATHGRSAAKARTRLPVFNQRQLSL